MSNHSKPILQHKTISFSVKAVDDEQGLIEAYGSVFNNVDQGDDVVRPGAFKRTIQNSKARVQAGKAKFLATMLYQHDADRPIGGWFSLEEDAHGLKCKGQIVLSTQLGRETYELIKAGVIDQFSIGYDIPNGGAKYDKDSGYRELKELRLWEISPVTFAMNQEALLTSVKKRSNKNVMTDIQKKDFNDRYREECIKDWRYTDFQNLVCALQASIMEIFSIGDEPQTDVVDTILEDSQDNKVGFINALKAYVQKGIDLDVSNYLAEIQTTSSSSYYGGYMSSDQERETKAGRSLSATNAGRIQDHVDAMHALADKATKDMKVHTKAIHSAADDLATVLQGSEPAYTTDSGNAGDRQEGKNAAPHDDVRRLRSSTNEDTADDAELSQALAMLQKLRSI